MAGLAQPAHPPENPHAQPHLDAPASGCHALVHRCCGSGAARGGRAAHASATRRRRPAATTSQKANATADQAIYQPVEYANAGKKGPALVVIPGEIKSNNATFLQKFTANNIADFGELELSQANFQVLERSDLGPMLNEFSLAYNLGDPASARKFLGMGKLKSTKYVVKFDMLKTEQVAAAQSGFDGRTIGAMAGLLGAFGGSRGGARPAPRRRRRLGADERIDRRLDHRHALQDHQRRDHRAGRHRLHRGEDGGRRQVDLGDGRFAVAAGRRSLDTMVQRLIQKIVWEIDNKYK